MSCEQTASYIASGMVPWEILCRYERLEPQRSGRKRPYFIAVGRLVLRPLATFERGFAADYFFAAQNFILCACCLRGIALNLRRFFFAG
jgi:hypothetical protein